MVCAPGGTSGGPEVEDELPEEGLPDCEPELELFDELAPEDGAGAKVGSCDCCKVEDGFPPQPVSKTRSGNTTKSNQGLRLRWEEKRQAFNKEHICM